MAEFSRESLSGLSAETQLKLANTMLRVLAERPPSANARISRVGPRPSILTADVLPPSRQI
ncbi:MAG: hypothetical protein IPK20_16950 [Betaproteobacteria bacterium]|nr:hypothetical protein [Betaproteobacteria bacterium]